MRTEPRDPIGDRVLAGLDRGEMLKSLDDIGMLGGDVLGLGEVGVEIEEFAADRSAVVVLARPSAGSGFASLHRAVAVGKMQLPSAVPHRFDLLAATRCVVPVEDRSTRERLRRRIEPRREHAAAFDFRGRLGADRLGDRRQHVDRVERSCKFDAGRNPPRPARDPRHPHAAFEGGALRLAKRPRRAGVIAVGDPRSVVAREDDERVGGDAGFLECVEDRAGGRVDLRDDVCVETSSAAAVTVFAHRERHVRHRMRQVQEERRAGPGVPADELDAARCDLGGEASLVRVLLDKPLAIGIAFAQRQRRIVLRTLWMPRPHVVGVGDAPPFVEAVLRRQERLPVAEMPLAVERRRVALSAAEFRERQRVLRHACRRSRPQGARDPDPMRIAPGEQRCPRGGADRLRHREVRGTQPFTGHRIEARRLDARASVAGEIAVAEVVGEDDHDVRRRRGRLVLERRGSDRTGQRKRRDGDKKRGAT